MRAIAVENEGPDSRLVPTTVDRPSAGPGEVVVAVAAAGLNRADLMQRQGLYPPPAGASPILGLEVSGTVDEVGDGVTDLAVGDEVCALLAGGGYAEYVAVPAVQVLPVPDGVDLVEAAALPEVAATVWSNLVLVAGLRSGERLLVHGGASGIGTHAIQLARALGAEVAVTAGSQRKLDICAEFGATTLIDYHQDDFVDVVDDLGGADVILDIIGAKYLARNVDALASGGRLVIIGMQGGAKAELDISTLLPKRASVTATNLRGRPVEGPTGKGTIMAGVRETTWPLVADGSVRPVVDRTFPLEEADAAHRHLDGGDAVGKVLLTV
ncbi:NAD(P)H-quinone oxidoreductase [Williamsia serinedens]|uniref:NAD(P)H quinone oxidoreductase, PIG3 family n=1 Tax=Williamsia serinedens TaxID=391736 RepID=A0ABT1GYZ1_9NOCA|nr:NAD(P)H-quinone oxidoreductase [Williamsia serinedens]MCP2160214.1 putative NAD(P)H quinone oxidoreductase, PIG3 family [Williamsia serinedens]